MSRAHIAFIFNRFYRIGAEVRRSRTGTGLGLFIVKSVVRGHHGTVSAESAGPGPWVDLHGDAPGRHRPARRGGLRRPWPAC